MNDDMTNALRTIGLALHASHNTVTTDDPAAAVGANSWRIDHASAIQSLELLESHFAASTGTCPVCGHRRSGP
jgi:hypothetical protein